MLEIENFIDGEFVSAVSQESLDDFNPATGQKIGNISSSNQRDVDNAVKAANDALAGWSSLSLDERIIWLEKIADALETKKEEIAKVESLDTGKPISLARRVDASRSITNFRFFSRFAKEQESLEFEMTDATNYVHRKPVGIVGLITPWNLPLYLLTWKIAPALVMGNTIIAKPSELTPLTANLFAKTLQEIDFPKGVFNIVHGLGPEAGQAILEHPEIKAISFTGGTQTGRIVARTAAPLFKKLSLELGGKNASVILDDADLELAAKGAAKAGFTNSGQVCLCGSRILIDESIADEFTALLIKEIESMKIGDPQNEDTDIGSVISISHLEKVESYVELALQEGGNILIGGNRPILDGNNANGAFLSPTVISGLDINSRTATEEIFGPVVTLHTFKDEAEAVEMANNTDYGLAGSVWTKNSERGKEFSKLIETGIMWVNTWLHRDLRTPFGGVKNSGVGREGGQWSLSFFSEMTNICVKHG
ncbi:MAG: 2-hydroxymuconic semialdehyde dehydrogenase [Euryarchaeota archaeon]|nr:2-hydroxymuconic semialdehyde dehydrogenase [Euryarchaeota archaeon]